MNCNAVNVLIFPLKNLLGEGFAGFDREGGYTDRMIDGKTGVLPIDEAGGQIGVDELFVQEELDDQAAKVLRHSLKIPKGNMYKPAPLIETTLQYDAVVMGVKLQIFAC
jgi:hypothetical protein